LRGEENWLGWEIGGIGERGADEERKNRGWGREGGVAYKKGRERKSKPKRAGEPRPYKDGGRRGPKKKTQAELLCHTKAGGQEQSWKHVLRVVTKIQEGGVVSWLLFRTQWPVFRTSMVFFVLVFGRWWRRRVHGCEERRGFFTAMARQGMVSLV